MKFLRVASLLVIVILQFAQAQENGEPAQAENTLLSLKNDHAADVDLLSNDYSQLCGADNNLALIATPTGHGGGSGQYGPANMNDLNTCAHYWPSGHGSWINYDFPNMVTVDRFVIATEAACQDAECGLSSKGRGIQSGVVRYKNAANQWVVDGTFSSQGKYITYQFNSCVMTTQIQVAELITHWCPGWQGDNPKVYEWSVCECESSPTPTPTTLATAPPTPSPTPQCDFDCSLDPAVICLPPKFNYQHSRVLLNGITYLEIETTIPKIWDVASTNFVGETFPHGVVDMDVHTTHTSGDWHMNASEPCESTLTGLVPWDSLWDNGALTLDSSAGFDEYEFVFNVDAERQFAYTAPVLLEADLKGLTPQAGQEIQRSSNEFPVTIIFETEVTVELSANIISEQIAVVLQSATMTTTRSHSAPFANAELIFSTFVTNPVWLGTSALSISANPSNLAAPLTLTAEAMPLWECSNTDPQCRQQWKIEFPLNLCELDHDFDMSFNVHCNAAEFPACADISKQASIRIEVESPDICPKALEPVTVTATPSFITQSGLPTAFFFSDQVVSVRVDVTADAEIVGVEILDVEVTPALDGVSTLKIWEFSQTVAAYHPDTQASADEYASYAVFSFVWDTDLFALPPASCTVKERLLITYSSGAKLLLSTEADLPNQERPHYAEASTAVIPAKESRPVSDSGASQPTTLVAMALLAVSMAFVM